MWYCIHVCSQATLRVMLGSPKTHLVSMTTLQAVVLLHFNETGKTTVLCSSAADMP